MEISALAALVAVLSIPQHLRRKPGVLPAVSAANSAMASRKARTAAACNQTAAKAR